MPYFHMQSSFFKSSMVIMCILVNFYDRKDSKSNNNYDTDFSECVVRLPVRSLNVVQYI